MSLGERNIIALCYFFTQILSNQDIGKLYQDEELVVIDDPISSFDFENKVGNDLPLTDTPSFCFLKDFSISSAIFCKSENVDKSCWKHSLLLFMGQELQKSLLTRRL